MERISLPIICEVCGLVPVAPSSRGATVVVAESAVMQATLKRAARFAASEAPIMLLGETGAGKEVVARVIHGSGQRAAAPFVAVNVAALPAELLESELFGHARGAFTGAASARAGLFEAAAGGTLFLDEIGEMPLPLQAKLLRALQDGEVRRVGDNRAFAVDVRVLCATHRDLDQLVARGEFRQDLVYRLRVLTLRVPPLRERAEDILPLARRFLADERSIARDFSAAAAAVLAGYPWPGNVRELHSAVRHAAALADGKLVQPSDLPEELFAPAQGRGPDGLRTLAEVEREHIARVLEACDGSPAEAARILGIGRTTLWRKLHRGTEST